VTVAILEREMYTEAAAAALLRVAPSTLHWWLEGRLPRYRPVIRVEPTGSRVVTWAEFVEAALLRSYRRDHEVQHDAEGGGSPLLHRRRRTWARQGGRQPAERHDLSR
jgi:hypothetical protein